MEVIIAIVGTIATVIGTYFTWISGKKVKSNVEKNNEHVNERERFQNIMLNKCIRVGYLDYPPLVSKTSDNTPPIGVYVKILEDIRIKYQFEIKWKLINLSDSVNRIVKDEIDIFICIFQTPRRSKNAKFISFLHSLEVYGITKIDFPKINSINSLKQKNIKYVVCKESVGDEILDSILKIPKSQKSIIDTNKISSIVSYVQSGFADIALADGLVCSEFMNENPKSGLKLIRFNPPIAIYNIGFMVAENNNIFSDWIEKEIDLIVSNADFIRYEKTQIDKYKHIINKIK